MAEEHIASSIKEQTLKWLKSSGGPISQGMFDHTYVYIVPIKFRGYLGF